MGKRLDQQPMYPQYTYYYPHYLQTKVGCGGPGAWQVMGRGAARTAGSPLLSVGFFPWLPRVRCRAELSWQAEGRRQRGRKVADFLLISLFMLIFFLKKKTTLFYFPRAAGVG